MCSIHSTDAATPPLKNRTPPRRCYYTHTHVVPTQKRHTYPLGAGQPHGAAAEAKPLLDALPSPLPPFDDDPYRASRLSRQSHDLHGGVVRGAIFLGYIDKIEPRCRKQGHSGGKDRAARRKLDVTCDTDRCKDRPNQPPSAACVPCCYCYKTAACPTPVSDKPDLHESCVLCQNMIILQATTTTTTRSGKHTNPTR